MAIPKGKGISESQLGFTDLGGIYPEGFTVNSPIHETESTSILLKSFKPFVPAIQRKCISSGNQIILNDLPEVQIVAGNTVEFVYTIAYDSGELMDLLDATCTVTLFHYSNPYESVLTITGSPLDYPDLGKFSVEILGSSTEGLFGIYQQQVRIVEQDGTTHVPSQGKIVILPNV